MDPVEYFSDLFQKMGTPNLLVIGIVILVLWLLISGIRKGLRKGGPPQRGEENEKQQGED